MLNKKILPPMHLFKKGAISGKLWDILVTAYISDSNGVDIGNLFDVTGRKVDYAERNYISYRIGHMNKTLEKNGSLFRIKPGVNRNSYSLIIQ